MTQNATKDDLNQLKKCVHEDIENAVAQISSAVINALEETNNKIDNNTTEIRELKVEVVEVKRRLTDLETDMPSAQTCRKHDLRISKLEKSAFASA